MHPCLIGLGIRPEVAHFFQPYFNSDGTGNLVFTYGNDIEHFGFAFHRVPDSEFLWVAGNMNFKQVSRAFICGSAMDAIAYFHFHYPAFRYLDTLLFLSVGLKPNPEQMRWINQNLAGKIFTLIFSNDLLGRVADLKMAAGISRLPVAISLKGDEIIVDFRHKRYAFPASAFSLNALEKRSGHRFNIRTIKPKNSLSYLAQLKEK